LRPKIITVLLILASIAFIVAGLAGGERGFIESLGSYL
jgi:hypothetical protein